MKTKPGLFWILVILIITIGFIIPQNFVMPVDGANKKCYNSNSYWFYPWGKSVTHKGVDIFAKKGTNLNSATEGIVIYKGHINRGGNVVLILGPQWRIHYYAHLDKIKTSLFNWINKGELIGTVGTSGNAEGKPPHLHYSIITLVPYIWRVDSDRQGWKKMWYLNPIDYLKKCS